jgi:hypothetical protein
MFFASIEYSGFSLAKGSGRRPLPALNEAGALVSPPVYAGTAPSLLPAISAPTPVSVAPSLCASSVDTLA